MQATTGGHVDVAPVLFVYPWQVPVMLTAVPDEGYRFDRFTGAASGTVNPASFTPAAYCTVSAAFVRVCTLTLTQEGEGTVVRTPVAPVYDAGSVVVVKAAKCLFDCGISLSTQGIRAGAEGAAINRESSLKWTGHRRMNF